MLTCSFAKPLLKKCAPAGLCGSPQRPRTDWETSADFVHLPEFASFEHQCANAGAVYMNSKRKCKLITTGFILQLLTVYFYTAAQTA